MTDEKYWIALNGSSCAMTQMPLRQPLVTPTPEQLLGFPTFDAAREAQRVCLNSPIAEVKRFFSSLRADVEAGRIRVINPPHPQPPTRDETTWTESSDVHRAVQGVFIKTTSN